MDVVFRFAKRIIVMVAGQISSKARRPRSPPTSACAKSISAARAMPEPLLALCDVRAGYGDAVVLDGIAFELRSNGSLAVLGRNGVGKSTLLLTIMGYTVVHAGTHPVARARHHAAAAASAGAPRASAGWRRSGRFFLRSPWRKTSPSLRARALDLERYSTSFRGWRNGERSRGNHLSGGEQQMLAIARALMTNPTLLLLDEPLEGLAPIIVEEVAAAIRRMTDEEGTAIILVEQHAEVALSLTREAIVLERGSIVHRGPSQEIWRDQAMLDRLIGLRLAENAAS